MSEDNKNKQELKSPFEKPPEETKGESTGHFLLGDSEKTLFSQNRFEKKTKYSPLIIWTSRNVINVCNMWSFEEKGKSEVKNPITEHGQNKACDIMNHYESKNSGGGIQTRLIQPKNSPAVNVSTFMGTVCKILNLNDLVADLSRDIKRLCALAQTDLGGAYCQLAGCYEVGTKYTPQDLSKAWPFYSEAAKAGNAEAYSKIKTEFCSPPLTAQDITVIDNRVINKILQDYELEIKWGNKVAEYNKLAIHANCGNRVALYELGKYYLQSWDSSRGVDANLKLGICYLALSEQKGWRFAGLEKWQQMWVIIEKADRLAASRELLNIRRAKSFYKFVLWHHSHDDAMNNNAAAKLQHVNELLQAFKKHLIPEDSPLHTKGKTHENEKKFESNTERETFSKKIFSPFS